MWRQRKWPKVAAWRCIPGNQSLIIEGTNQIFFHSSFTEEEETWILEVPLESVRQIINEVQTLSLYARYSAGLHSSPSVHGPHFTDEKSEAQRHSVTYSTYWTETSECKPGSISFHRPHSFHCRTYCLFNFLGRKPSELSLRSDHPEEGALMQHFLWTKEKAVTSIWRRQYLVPHRVIGRNDSRTFGECGAVRGCRI